MPDFSSYLESVRRHYEQWWSLYTLTDAEGRSQIKAKAEIFDFGLMVQTIAPKPERMDGDRSEAKETIERFTVLEGLRKYAGEHVLLVGRPGSGKSTALARLLLEEALTPSPSPTRRGEQEIGRIPVLVELRYWNDDGVLGLIRSFLRSLPTQVGLTPVEVDRTTLEELLRSNQFLLLIDGLNELPSEVARQDVLRFRREFPKVAIVFTTRDLSLGGDFGIEKRLEMQPLTETQMKAFVTAYIPEQSEAMLRQLGGRLREFGSTPLLLWMLCGLFRQTGEIPANLGGVFRAFTTGYEGRLKADVVLEGDRRWWAGLLQALAARMMIGDGSVEFRVAIDRAEVEAIFTEYLRDREAQAAGAARKALDDLLRHHLIQANGSQVEFRHQLIQEYYAAEWLLGRVGGLDDATVQQEFLNYLKWTEPVALMLALVEDEALAVRVVELALEVDLMLGARLAGEVRSDFQERTVGLVNGLDVPEWLKFRLLGETRSNLAILSVFNSLHDRDLYVRLSAVEILGELGTEFAVKGLIKSLDDEDFYVRLGIVDSLGKIQSESAIQGLIKAIQDENSDVRIAALTALGRLQAQSSIDALIKVINDKDFYVRLSSIKALSYIGSEDVLPGLTSILSDEEPEIRQYIAAALGRIKSNLVVPPLLFLIQDEASEVRQSAAISLGNFGFEGAVDGLLEAIKDDNPEVRSCAVEALGKLNNELVIPGLLIATQDGNSKVRLCALKCLSRFQDKRSAHSLLKAIQDESSDIRDFVVTALGWMKTNITMPLISELTHLTVSESCEEAFLVLSAIQSSCKIYNYTAIEQQAKFRKAAPSLEGGGGDPSLAIIEDKLDRYREEVKQVTSEPKYGSKYSITGNPTIVEGNMEVKGDNVGTKNIHNYFGADEALLQQITDLQTFITEIEAQHPNLQTVDQANTVVQTKLDQLQTQNPDRWQKLRQQMQILKAQFFNPERHAQALKATVVEVTKAKWEESLIVKAIVTYLDKLSETPDRGV